MALRDGAIWDEIPPEYLTDGAPDPNRLDDPDYVPGEAPSGQIWVWENGGWVLKPVQSSAATTQPPPTQTGGGGRTPAQIEAEGRAADERDGLVGGYMRDGVWVRGSPRSTGGGAGGGGGMYSLPSRPGSIDYPQFNAREFAAPPEFSYPELEAGQPFTYDPFTYESYQMPGEKEIASEPGFDFALKQAQKAYENSKAYLGTYKTGATIKGLADYTNKMAFQNADRVISRSAENYDRNRNNAFGSWAANRDNAFGSWQANRNDRFNTWQANRNNAADNYATNYGISRDVFDRNYAGDLAEYNSRARGVELNAARDWDMFTYEGDDAYRRWKAQVDANS